MSESPQKITLPQIKKMIARGIIKKEKPINVLKLSIDSRNHALGSLLEIDGQLYICSYNMINGARSVFAKGYGDYFRITVAPHRKHRSRTVTSLASKEIFLADLLEKFPPDFIQREKQRFVNSAMARFATQAKLENPLIHVERFRAKSLDSIFVGRYEKLQIISVHKFFDYTDVSDDERKVWYLNFANAHLFGYYNTTDFSQDEIQVLEHPVLASIHLWLTDKMYKGLEPRTISGGEATPFTLENIPRWISVHTKNTGLFGGGFERAIRNNEFNKINDAITVNKQDHLNNLIAVAAPTGGTIESMMSALITAFGGAVSRNTDINGNHRKTVIHTGSWGTNVYAGSAINLLKFQILAALITGVDELVFHSIDDQLLKSATRQIFSIRARLPDRIQQYCSAAEVVESYFGVSTNNILHISVKK